MTDHTVGRALGVVGVDLDSLLAMAGSVLADGHPYLVGSLAVGLGNRGSDIDIHHFRPGIAEPAPPYLMFVDGVTVDVEYYPAEMPASTVSRYTGTPLATVADGRIALAPPPDRTVADRLTRWLTALPLYESSPPLIAEGDRATVVALLARVAYEHLVQFAALATLAEQPAAAYLWQRAARQALEVACRVAGDVATGDKWLPRRAVRTLSSRTLVESGYRAGTEPALRELLAALRVPLGDPLAMTWVQPCPQAREVAVGRTRCLITRHGRLFPQWTSVAGQVAAAVADVGAAQLLHGLRTGQLTMRVDPPACAEVLR
ncbi:hypothetical protein [Micromonospora sp. C95]|uniref:hypothetical protein n=1 Tax=Micromonospora sp. C95 TaxID=2824882 RepID=UPI001B3631AB|nr:hypothetical protein [Micromonospora sp. C95]MBQ1026022.1 hypothetical protein [Micromonospora sp. C95]